MKGKAVIIIVGACVLALVLALGALASTGGGRSMGDCRQSEIKAEAPTYASALVDDTGQPPLNTDLANPRCKASTRTRRRAAH